ncbi:unnamed protein product [Schistosoma turkestanicum]|nr:unnamed protein product [Schistosoma turkestanicum]
MDDLKAQLDAEHEKVAKLKALVIKERKVNAEIKSKLEYFESLHSSTPQENSRIVEKLDKCCFTSEFSNEPTCRNETPTSELDNNAVYNKYKMDGITDKTTSKLITSIPVCIISASSSFETSSSKDSLQNSDKHLYPTCLEKTTETQVDDLNYFTRKDSLLLLQQFNTALQSLKFDNKDNLSKDELKLVFTECNRLLEEIDLYSNDSYHNIPCNYSSTKREIIQLDNYCQTLSTDLNQYNNYSLQNSSIKQQDEQDLHHNELKHVYTDLMCNDELHILEERVNELKHSVEYAESSFNQLSDKLTSVTHINELYDAKLLQLQETCDDNSSNMIQSSIKLKTLFYDSFLLPLIQYYQEVNSDIQYDLNMDYFICNNFQNDAVSTTVAKNLNNFLNELKKIIKHYYYYTFNDKCTRLSDACILTDYNELNIEQERLLLDKLKSTKSELMNANEKILISENLITELKSQLQISEEKSHRMKNLLVKFKLDSAEQQKKLLEFQRTECIDVEKKELNCLTEKLSHTEREKEDLECSLTKLRSELTQQHVLSENLQNEKRLALDRLQKLQSEYTAYKVKAQHALSNARTLANDVNTNTSDNQNLERVNPDHVDSENTSFYYSNELESVKQNLLDVQNRMKETELHASLARSECDMLKKELIEVKTSQLLSHGLGINPAVTKNLSEPSQFIPPSPNFAVWPENNPPTYSSIATAQSNPNVISSNQLFGSFAFTNNCNPANPCMNTAQSWNMNQPVPNQTFGNFVSHSTTNNMAPNNEMYLSQVKSQLTSLYLGKSPLNS